MTRPPHPARGGSVADAEGGQSREGGPAPRRTGGISARSRARTTWWSSPGCWRAGAPRWWATCAAGSRQMLVTRSATSDGACRSDPTWPAPGRMTRAPWVRWLAAARALLAVCIRVAGATAGQPTITLHWDFICTTCRLRTGWLPMKHRPDGRAVRVIGGGARYRRAGSAGVALHPGGVMGAQGSVEVTADGGHGDGGATKLCQEVHGSGPPTTANCTGSVWPGRPGALAQRRRGPAHRDPSRRFLARARWPRLS